MHLQWFVPNGFVGKEEDDDTPKGLLRRFHQADHPFARLVEERVGIPEPGHDQTDVWVQKIEAHFGCKHDGTSEL